MKKLLTLTLAAALTAAMGVTAFAEEVDSKPGQADLELTNGGIKILDIDEDELPEGFDGIKPLSVNFGSHSIKGVAEDIDGKDKVGIIVQDARGLGAGSQWEVIVKLDYFHLVVDNTVTSTVTLAGSQLTFEPFGNVVPSSDLNGAKAPAPETVDLAPGAASGKKIFASAPTLEGGSAGTWGVNWSPTLNVPATAEVGKHQAKLTWSLQSGV